MPKKTVDDIIRSGNDYVIGLKANQPNLLAAAEQIAREQRPLDQCTQSDKSHGRMVHRTCKVYKAPPQLRKEWPGLKRIVVVRRWGKRGTKPYEETSYYISSLKKGAAVFNTGIRQHWAIENKLHWVKDVDFGEDKSRIRSGNAPAIMSIIRNIVINILREKGFQSIAQGKRMFAHDFNRIWELL